MIWKRLRSVVRFAGAFGIYIFAVMAVVRSWHSKQAWKSLDFYVIATLAFSAAMAVVQVFVSERIATSSKVKDEFFGLSFDRTLGKWVSAISICELLAFADYAHRRFLPVLIKPELQIMGIVAYSLALLWMVRVDLFLIKHFEGAFQEHRLLCDGPFRILRHPRYTALLISRLAFALTIASVIAWILLPLWVLAVISRINKEEAHLRRAFGSTYDDFTRTRARLLPGVY